MAETFNLISIISFIVALIFTILAVVLWFAFKIPSVIGDLSGRTAKKSIENLHKHNDNPASIIYKPSSTNSSRSKLTDTMEQDKKKPDSKETHYETGLLNDNKVEQYEGEETGILLDDEATGMLSDDNVTELLIDEEETGILTDENSKEVFEDDRKEEDLRKRKDSKLTMIDETIYIHTDEVIWWINKETYIFLFAKVLAND